MKTSWHMRTADEVVREWDVDPSRGLDEKEWERRYARFGPNKLEDGRRATLWELFVKQFSDFMVAVLIGAAVLSALLGEGIDAVAILAIVILNAVLGFFQESKAERSLAALKEMTAPTTTVRREGSVRRIEAARVVPGDIILLKEGDRVPADARLLSQASLAVDESPLTGESVPVKKDAAWVGSAACELAERRNMVYMGTSVVKGRCEAVVVATAMRTEIGDIAAMIHGVEDGQTPLQRRLEEMGRWLVLACLALVGAVFAAGVWTGTPVYTMFLTAVSLAVAAIPEGLPAVVTVALALGVQRMIKRNAIVRRLPAVETLGCATVICSDKTGTLTRNEMTVTRLFLAGGEVEVTGRGYAPVGAFKQNGVAVGASDPDLHRALLVAGLCNDAALVPPKRRGKGAAWSILGDPTEGALLVLAHKGGKRLVGEMERARRVAEIPFDSDRKRMSVLVATEGGLFSLVKGAPDAVLSRCTRLQEGGEVRPLSHARRSEFLEQAEAFAQGALRVLALAYKPVRGRPAPKEPSEADLESSLILVGLAAMMDPPRPEVAGAIARARQAGIETVMVTGDHPATARAVARQIGLASGGALTGKDIDSLDDQGLMQACRKVRIFARVSPRHKLRIVRAYKELGHVVAMTGDGVNDAPAIKEADIGVAMGLSGTDVSREASAMVLADDNFATIVAAVEEGRGIYDNIRKFIRYLLACNTGEVLTMFFATLLGWPIPLVPVQILWMNLVTDGLPAMALGVDPPEKDVMNQKPRRPNEWVFSRGLHVKILVRGFLIACAAIAAFALGAFLAPPGTVDRLGYARTLAFTTLVASQLIYVFQCRSERKSLSEIGFFGNPWLLFAVGASFAMQLAVLYWPSAAAVFRTTPLSGSDWAVVLLLASFTQVAEGVLIRARRRARATG